MRPEEAAPPENPEEAPDKADPEESAYCFLDSTRPCNSSCVAYVPQYRPNSPAKGSLNVFQRCEPLNLARRAVAHLERLGKGNLP